MSDTVLRDAARMLQSGNLAGAANLYESILRTDPRQIEALYRLGTIHLQYGRHNEAERLFAAAITLNSGVPELFLARGSALHGLRRHEEALASFAQALALNPAYAEARHQRGVVLLDLARYAEALACFDRVASESPGLAFVEGNRAVALNGLERHEEALTAAGKALALDAGFAMAWYQRGAALASLGRNAEAVLAFDKAVAIDPKYTDAYSYRGIVLSLLQRHEEALASYNDGLRTRPGDADLLFNRASVFAALRRHEEAVADTQAALKRDPAKPYALGNLVLYKLQLADWRRLDALAKKTLTELRAGQPSIRPLQSNLISDSEEDQLRSARLWAEPLSKKPLWTGERNDHARLRVAYVSADFRDHAVARLIAGVFNHHDKSRIAPIAVSLGPDDRSAMRTRLSNAFEHFIDGRNRSDAELAASLREMETDIAVDLTGYTEGGRQGIFAHRPAPVQVNYLGYPGTMGAAYYDYILTDAIAVPFAQQPYYSEKLVHLPGCYLPNDSSRPIPGKRAARGDAGLPYEAFVFCAMNAVQKITPAMFDVWMRLLTKIEGSVLWLSQTTPAAIKNLRREASERGISGERLIFAPFMPSNEEHIARLALADLFLDTLPYNAHASACDALWAGVPIVTATGRTFAGRVGASLLSALDLPELVAADMQGYETLAFELARAPEKLAAVKAKLARNRETSSLYDTARFTRNLEAAYFSMWERHRNGEQPASFAVENVVSAS